MTHKRPAAPRRSARRIGFAVTCVLVASGCGGSISIEGAELPAATAPPPSPPAAPAPVSGAPAASGAAAPSTTPPPVSTPAAPATGSGAVAGDDACRAESDAELCRGQGAECGALAAVDNCGVSRAVASCGACMAAQSCGAQEPNRCGLAQSGPVEEYTLVVVRHGQSRANECSDACGGVACCRAYPCADGCSDCYCPAWQNDFTERGWDEVKGVLPDRLAALGMRWDQILVSPAWRTQATIKAYLEREDLHGQIVPELDECSVTSSCPRGSCAVPPWQSEPYELIEFEGGEMRLSPRAHRPDWDPDASSNPRPRYDHEAAHLDGERVIMDRAVQYLEEQFAAGAATLLIVTHRDVGRGMLQRLTDSDDEFNLDNAAAYSVLKRKPAESHWRIDSFNSEP